MEGAEGAEVISVTPQGVQAGLAFYLPQTGMNWNSEIWSESSGAEQLGIAYFDRVSPGYFDAIGTRLLAGRGIEPSDRLGSHGVGVVNQAFVSLYCKGRDPIGMRFGADGPTSGADYEIVGVVEDAKYDGTRMAVHPTFFLSILQPELNAKGALDSDGIIGGIVLHVSAGADNLEPALRKAIAEVDPNLGVTAVRSYSEQMAENFNQERLLARLTQLFGGLALVLASIGLYGLVALSAARRTTEIGVRMALGASRRDVVGMILRSALLQVAIGVAIGIPLAAAGSGLIGHQLFGISATSPATMAIAGAILIVCAAAAAFLPAGRAARTDPMRALRAE